MTQVPIGKEAGWAPEPVWTLFEILTTVTLKITVFWCHAM
jgi:hypothetical protein